MNVSEVIQVCAYTTFFIVSLFLTLFKKHPRNVTSSLHVCKLYHLTPQKDLKTCTIAILRWYIQLRAKQTARLLPYDVK